MVLQANTITTESNDAVTKLHKAAATLNNIGCSLLEQGAFEDALETFNNAVYIMKTICASKNDRLADREQVTAISENLKQAYQRLRSPHISQVLCSEPSLHDASSPAFSLLTFEDYLMFEFNIHTACHHHHTFLCPTRVTERSHCCCDNGQISFNADLDSASMLYNLGLAYMCVSKCQAVPQEEAVLKLTAIRLFELSDSVLHKQQFGSSTENQKYCCCHHDEDEVQFVAALNVAVLHSLVQLLAQSDFGMNSSMAMDVAFEHLLTMQQYVYKIKAILKDNIICAAAA